jgi:hypothetical protein
VILIDEELAALVANTLDNRCDNLEKFEARVDDRHG